MKNLNDPVFGELSFQGAWTRQIDLAFLGSRVKAELIVEGNDKDESIFCEQRKSFEMLEVVIPQVEDAILEYYKNELEDIRARFGNKAEERLPKIKHKSELQLIVELTGVVFPAVMDAGELSIGFLFECAWNPEDGLGAKFINNEIEVGTQDLVT